MTQQSHIEIEDIGSVLFVRSKRAKNIVISIRPFVGVQVSFPKNISLNSAVQFVHQKSVWIKKHQLKMKQYEQEHQTPMDNVPASNIDRKKAAEFLNNRLHFLAEKHGYRYNRVSIRCQKTRWGSCSPQNNISLNAKLTLLPPELQDYVLLHELAHTRFHNHGEHFWGEMDKLVGNGKQMASRLHQYNII